MTTARGPTATTSATTRGTWITRAAIAAAVLGVFLLVAVTWISVFGSVSGEEFSPDTFSRRTFEYQEVPLVGWRIGAVSHEIVSGPLEKRLQGDPALLPPSPHDPPRWHVITMVRGAQPYSDDAQILRRYLTAGDEKSPYWLEWTNQHKELAKVFWPAVVAATRSGQYLRLPDLFAAAEQLTVSPDAQPTVEEFRRALEAIVAKGSRES
jgi:hypothetical protein